MLNIHLFKLKVNITLLQSFCKFISEEERIMKEVTIMPPEHAVETETAYFWLDEDGMVVIFSKPGKHELHHATKNIEISIELIGDKERPLLIDMTTVKSMSRAARQEYATKGSEKPTAVALVSSSLASRIIANFFMGLNKPPVPTRVFNDFASAKKWIMKYV